MGRNMISLGCIGVVGASALMLAGCPGFDLSTLPSADIGGTSDYVGAGICQRCHTDAHALWRDSRHANALVTLRTAGQEANRDCLACHSTGFGRRGFVSAALTPGLAGVQCEACHGPGATHVGSRNPADIVRIPGTAVCGGCHTGPQQPDHDEWLVSAHARALATVRESPQAEDSCLTCHSYDYALAAWRNQDRVQRGLQPLSLPSVTDRNPDNDPIEAVGCGSCHHPHGSNFPAQMRSTITDTCAKCHSDAAPAAPADVPHSPQTNLLNASSGWQLDDARRVAVPLRGLPSVHSQVDSLGGCAKCHGTRVRFDSPTASSPNKHGHDFEVAPENCVPCHSRADALLLLNGTRGDIVMRLSLIRQRISSIDRGSLLRPGRDLYDAATFNMHFVEADRSHGAHNGRYARELLERADNLLDQAQLTR